MNLIKAGIKPPQESEVASRNGAGVLPQEQDYIGLSFLSQGGSHSGGSGDRECDADLNIGGMELRLAPPRAVELAQESVKDVCFEQISCRENLISNIREDEEKSRNADAIGVVAKLSGETDQKQKQAALFSLATGRDSGAASNFWHVQKLQQQHMAATPEFTPFHLSLGAQRSAELSRHGWGGALSGLAWSRVFIPGAQEQDSEAIPQMLVYGGYGHQVEVSTVAPAPVSQASGFLAGSTHTKELEKPQIPKMFTSSSYYISEKSTTASGPLYLGNQLQGKMGSTGYGANHPNLCPNSSIQLTTEGEYWVRGSCAAVEEKSANASSPHVVGWPPVQSFRKNSAVAHCQSKPINQRQDLPLVVDTSTVPSPTPPDGGIGSLFVKVYMDGVPIGRKVDLKANDSYEKLSLALEGMFEQFVTGHCLQEKFPSKRENPSPSSDKKPSFLHGSDYVMTYEDKDGDLMLVGDVPWSLFATTVKRLRIMKGCEAIGFERAKEKAAN